MAKKTVVFVREFVLVTPAGVIETRLLSGGPVVQLIPVPESRHVCKVGDRIVTRNARDLATVLERYGDAVRVE